MNKEYIDFIAGLKQNIIQSRYTAARLVNKEALLLYFKIGKMLSEKIAAEKWGTKVIEQIAEDLQKQLPGLKGFSSENLRKMRRFAIENDTFLIWSSLPTKLEPAIGPLPTAA
jgi:predicted nuclease of restriction endonuclease-like (RecB) superfamily